MQINKVQLKWFIYAYTMGIMMVSVLPVNSKGSSSPINHQHILSIRLDYLLHGSIYIPWVVVIWFVTRFSFKTAPLKASKYLVFCLLFAVVMEFVQFLLPYRTFSLIDLSSNVSGVILGFILLLFFKN